MQGAVLGLPIQLISRMAGITAGAAGTRVGQLVKYGTTASIMIGSVAPHLAGMMTGTGDQPGALGGLLSSLVSFMDLNASNLQIFEKKRIALIDIPGRQSDWIQDMGRKSTIYKLKGKFFAMDYAYPGMQTSSLSTVFRALYGDAAVGNSYLLRLIEQLGVPIPFISKLDIAEVLIASVTLESKGGKSDFVDYDMTLIEYRKLPTIGKLAALAASHLIGDRL